MGQLILLANNVYAANYLPADGRLLDISSYTALFSLLGTSFGGDGTTTFALPNLAAAAPNGTWYVICVQGVFP